MDAGLAYLEELAGRRNLPQAKPPTPATQPDPGLAFLESIASGKTQAVAETAALDTQRMAANQSQAEFRRMEQRSQDFALLSTKANSYLNSAPTTPEPDYSFWGAKPNGIADLFVDRPQQPMPAGEGETVVNPAGPDQRVARPDAIGFREALAQNPTKFIPVAGSLFDTTRLMSVMDAAKRLEQDSYPETVEFTGYVSGVGGYVPTGMTKPPSITGKEQRQRDLQLVTDWENERRDAEERGYDFGGRVGQILGELPAFMGEIALTSGAGGVVKKVTTEALEKVVGKSLVKGIGGKVAGTVAAGVTQGTLMPQRTAAAYMQRRMPDVVKMDEQGNPTFSWPEENPYTSLLRAWGDTAIEAVSERSGGAVNAVGRGIGKVLGKTAIGGKIMPRIYQGYKRLHPDTTWAQFVDKASTTAGFNGILGEVGEEYIGDQMRAVTDVDDFGAGKDSGILDRMSAAFVQDVTNTPEMLVSFAVPGVTRIAAKQVLGQKPVEPGRKTPYENEQPKPNTMDEFAAKMRQEQGLDELPVPDGLTADQMQEQFAPKATDKTDIAAMVEESARKQKEQQPEPPTVKPAEEVTRKEPHLMSLDEFRDNAGKYVTAYGNPAKYVRYGQKGRGVEAINSKIDANHALVIMKALEDGSLTPDDAIKLHKKDHPQMEGWDAYKNAVSRQSEQPAQPEPPSAKPAQSAKSAVGAGPEFFEKEDRKALQGLGYTIREIAGMNVAEGRRRIANGVRKEAAEGAAPAPGQDASVAPVVAAREGTAQEPQAAKEVTPQSPATTPSTVKEDLTVQKQPWEMTWGEIKTEKQARRAALPAQVAAAEAKYADARKQYDDTRKKQSNRIKAILKRIARLNPTGDLDNVSTADKRIIAELESERDQIVLAMRDAQAPIRSDFVSAETAATYIPSGQYEHINAVKRAVSEGQPVPRSVLEEYKSEPWAAEALSKLEKGSPRVEEVQTQTEKVETTPAPSATIPAMVEEQGAGGTQTPSTPQTAEGALPKGYSVFNRGETQKDAYGRMKPVKLEQRYGVLTDKGIDTRAYGRTPEEAVATWTTAVAKPKADTRPDYVKRVEAGEGTAEDVHAIASDYLREKFGPPSRSAKSEAEYFTLPDNRRIRLARHSVVYEESDVDLFIGVGKLLDADVVIPADAASATDIRSTIDDALASFNPSPRTQSAGTQSARTLEAFESYWQEIGEKEPADLEGAIFDYLSDADEEYKAIEDRIAEVDTGPSSGTEQAKAKVSRLSNQLEAMRSELLADIKAKRSATQSIGPQRQTSVEGEGAAATTAAPALPEKQTPKPTAEQLREIKAKGIAPLPDNHPLVVEAQRAADAQDAAKDELLRSAPKTVKTAYDPVGSALHHPNISKAKKDAYRDAKKAYDKAFEAADDEAERLAIEQYFAHQSSPSETPTAVSDKEEPAATEGKGEKPVPAANAGGVETAESQSEKGDGIFPASITGGGRILGLTEPKENVARDGSTIAMQYRVRPTTEAERDQMRQDRMITKVGQGMYVVERRRIETEADGTDSFHGNWAAWQYGTTEEEAVAAGMGDSEYAAMMNPQEAINAKETSPEPAGDTEVDAGQADESIPEEQPEGDLDPANYDDALKITEMFANLPQTERGGYGRGEIRGANKELLYTMEQVEQAYGTVMKPVQSPMNDVALFAMPGHEKEVAGIGQEMAGLKPMKAPTARASIGRPKTLPKAAKNAAEQVQAVFAAARDPKELTDKDRERLYGLTGVHIDGENLVATDGRRMFIAKGQWGEDGTYTDQAALKRGSLGKLNTEVTFPKWRDVMPDTSGQQAVRVEDIATVWRRVHQAGVMADERYNRPVVVVLNTDGSLGFVAAMADAGTAEINTRPGGRILGGLRSDYLLDVLAFHAKRGNKAFDLYFNKPDSPMVTRSDDGKTTTATMPIDAGYATDMAEDVLGIDQGNAYLSNMIAARDFDSLKELLAPTESNEANRVQFTKETGITLPDSVAGTENTIGEFVAGRKQSPATSEKKTGGSPGKAAAPGKLGGIAGPGMPMTMEPVAEKPPVTARQIIEGLGRALMVPIRGMATNRSGTKAGWYEVGPKGIRQVNVQALDTTAHEIGHHIDHAFKIRQAGVNRAGHRMYRLPPGLEKGADKELLALGKQLYGDTKPAGGYKSEGIAEFIRGYLTEHIEVRVAAPKFYKWFVEDYLPDNPDVASALKEAKTLLTEWRRMGAEARIESKISEKQPKGPIVSRVQAARQWIYGALWDELIPLKTAVEQSGATLDPKDNPYDLATYLNQTEGARARHMILDGTIDIWGNRTGKGLKEVMEPIVRQRAVNEFRRWMISARALDLISRGIDPGISKEDAQFVYDKYKDNEGWKEAAEDVTAWNSRVLDYLVQAGGLEADAAARMRELNPVYVPFLREFAKGEKAALEGVGRGVLPQGKVHGIKGSGREIIDPYQGMIQQAQRLVSLAHKTMVAKSLADLADKTPGMASIMWPVPAPKQATTFQAEQVKRQLMDLGVEFPEGGLETMDALLTVYTNSPVYRGKDNIISIVRNGKRSWYEVDPVLYRVLKGLDQFTLPAYLRWTIALPTRVMRFGATGINAAFGWVRNPIRDTLNTVFSARFARGPFATMKGLAMDLSTTGLAKAMGVKPNEAAEQYLRQGGEISGFVGQDRSGLQHVKGEMLASTVGRKTIHTVTHPFDAMRELFGISENAPRMAEYAAALKKYEEQYGKDSPNARIMAFNAASDQTINFRRHGWIGKWLNQLIPFWNAAMQDPDKIVRTFKTRGVEATAWATALLTLPAVALWWWDKDDEWYKELPDYERANYLHIQVGEDRIIRLPVPFLVGHLFQSVPVAALDALYRSDPKRVTEVLGEAFKSDVGAIANAPAFISPLLEVAANKDWSGKPIVTESMRNKQPNDQYTKYTGDFARAVASAINSVSPRKVAPVQLQYLMNAYSGGIYSRTQKVVQTATKSADERQLADLPVFGTLFVRDPYAPRDSIERFYSRREELNQAYTSDKTKMTGSEMVERTRINRAGLELTEIWKELRDTGNEAQRRRLYGQIKGLIDSTKIDVSDSDLLMDIAANTYRDKSRDHNAGDPHKDSEDRVNALKQEYQKRTGRTVTPQDIQEAQDRIRESERQKRINRMK